MSFKQTQKIGRPGPGGVNKKISGLLVTGTFFSNGISDDIGHRILTTSVSNASYLMGITEATVFSSVVKSRYFNVTSGWSTGSWQMDLLLRGENGVEAVFNNQAMQKSVSCDQADQVINDFNWSQKPKNINDFIAVEMRTNEDFSPTVFTRCETSFFRTEFKILFPNLNGVEDFENFNPSVSALQSYNVQKF